MSQLATKRGFDGTVHLSNGTTNYPLNAQSGFNLEGLIALDWSTYLNGQLFRRSWERGHTSVAPKRMLG